MREQQELQQKWQQELDSEKHTEHTKFIENRERNLGLIKHNAAERELKAQQLEIEKLRDKEMLEVALAREKALQEIEDKERAERRNEVIALQQYYKQTQNDKEAYEKLVDEFVQHEAERQYKMREA